jgi:hypothetical protein
MILEKTQPANSIHPIVIHRKSRLDRLLNYKRYIDFLIEKELKDADRRANPSVTDKATSDGFSNK